MNSFSFDDLAFIGGLGGYDTDALAYIAAVETADGQSLEVATKDAINAFVVGCKADGIWSAIKASCIMAGARTLAGALVPLVGTAPTNFNFVSGDYNRKTGLVGNGSTKYLNSNRSNNSDSQNNKHISVFLSVASSGTHLFIGTETSVNVPGDSYLYTQPGFTTSRVHSSGTSGTSLSTSLQPGIGLYGVSRLQASGFTARLNGSNITVTDASQPPISQNITVFKGGSFYSSIRIPFYSIGEALDLALLDSRVAVLIAAIGAAF
jgi:hypothetical protein